MSYSLNNLYEVVGISKQAVHQYECRQISHDKEITKLLKEAEDYKVAHPGCGVEKLYYTLNPEFIGRDRFIETFMSLGFRVKRKKNFRRTTTSGKKKFPNLINGMRVSNANEVWQSDITYIRIKDKFYYAVFIIDVYTRQVVGYSISDHMRTSANLRALKMATEKFGYPKIHHSDRGTQYTSDAYSQKLIKNNTKISMGLIAQENAYAERINKTIKEEYIAYWKPRNFNQLKSQIKKAVNNYNTKRIHNNIKRMNPNQFHQSLKSKGNHILEIYDSSIHY